MVNHNENQDLLMEDLYVEYPRQPTEVIVQEIGNATFLEFDGNLVNVDDLAKYRKVFNANSKYMYYINIDKVICSILLLLSFFSKSIFIVVSCAVGFLSSLGFLFSMKLINGTYVKLVCVCVVASFLSCLGNVMISLASSGNTISAFILLVTFIYYIVLSYLINCVTRIQTILKIVPEHLYYKLK